jgi:hypothetical protein
MGIKMRSGFKKQLWKLAYAKSTIYQAKLSCEFIINNSQLMDRATYNVLVTGFTIMYVRLFDSGNAGVGCLPASFGKFTDSRLQTMHDALLQARNLFTAHLNACYKYVDEKEIDKDEILKLYIRVGPVGPDGQSDVEAFFVSPVVPRDNIPIYKALCEDLLPRLDMAEKELIVKLYDGAGVLKAGDNPINIFDES